MNLAVEIFISALLVVGGVFGLVGSFGLLKLKLPMQRLHGPTKAVTMGVATALIAAAMDVYVSTGAVAWQNVMIAVFLFLTAPISALYIAKAHLHSTVDPSEVSPTGSAAVWAGTPGAAETE
ncbi:MAG: monovalent cation/H(+) antiporter subunit G [Rhodobacteraceae bacterium]|nr:monovalent cation/H(+) antiporter subunit G [Paracoccaceae bacterium]